MAGLGAPELIIIALVIILLFGWKRLPDAARSLGRSARVFKAEVSEMKHEDEVRAASTPVPPTVTPPAAPPVAPQHTTPPPPPPASYDANRGSALLDDYSPRTDNKSGPVA